jgi:hypothetical protein
MIDVGLSFEPPLFGFSGRWMWDVRDELVSVQLEGVKYYGISCL